MVSFASILVPFDFGEPSRHALEVAIDLAKQYQSTLTIVHTWQYPSYAYGGTELAAVEPFPAIRDEARHDLDELLEDVKKQLPDACAVLRRGEPSREILKAIEECHADLVVMGTEGRHGFGRILIRSVTEKIVRLSPVPVLVVRAAAPPAASLSDLVQRAETGIRSEDA